MAHGHKTGGRQLGTPNKVTSESRIALSALISSNLPKLTEWLDSVAGGIRKVDPVTGYLTDEYLVRPNPAKAFDMLMSVAEYHIPKLARCEVVVDEAASEQADQNRDLFRKLLQDIKTQRQTE